MADGQSSTATAAPVNGVKNGTHAPAPLASATTVTPDPTLQLKEQLKKAEGERDLMKREKIVERRQWENEKKTFGEKLKLADEYARLQKEAGVNAPAVAKRLWGDKWLEHLNTIAANGGAPTAESVAAEMDRREEQLRKEFADKEAAAEQSRQDAAREAENNDKQRIFGDAAAAIDALPDEYPIFSQLGDKERAAQVIAAQLTHAEFARYRSALHSQDVDACAKIMRGAMDRLETQMISIAEKAAEHKKYQERLSARLTPSKTAGTVPPVVKSQSQTSQPSQSQQSQSQPGRRTLSNDLTGSTPGDASKYRTDEERRAAALARYAELTSKQ